MTHSKKKNNIIDEKNKNQLGHDLLKEGILTGDNLKNLKNNYDNIIQLT